MGTLIYCDNDDCENSDHSYNKPIYSLHLDVKDKICLDIDHLCKYCLDEFILDGEISITDIIIEDDYITLRT